VTKKADMARNDHEHHRISVVFSHLAQVPDWKSGGTAEGKSTRVASAIRVAAYSRAGESGGVVDESQQPPEEAGG